MHVKSIKIVADLWKKQHFLSLKHVWIFSQCCGTLWIKLKVIASVLQASHAFFHVFSFISWLLKWNLNCLQLKSRFLRWETRCENIKIQWNFFKIEFQNSFRAQFFYSILSKHLTSSFEWEFHRLQFIMQTLLIMSHSFSLTHFIISAFFQRSRFQFVLLSWPRMLTNIWFNKVLKSRIEEMRT